MKMVPDWALLPTLSVCSTGSDMTAFILRASLALLAWTSLLPSSAPAITRRDQTGQWQAVLTESSGLLTVSQRVGGQWSVVRRIDAHPWLDGLSLAGLALRPTGRAASPDVFLLASGGQGSQAEEVGVVFPLNGRPPAAFRTDIRRDCVSLRQNLEVSEALSRSSLPEKRALGQFWRERRLTARLTVLGPVAAWCRHHPTLWGNQRAQGQVKPVVAPPSFCESGAPVQFAGQVWRTMFQGGVTTWDGRQCRIVWWPHDAADSVQTLRSGADLQGVQNDRILLTVRPAPQRSGEWHLTLTPVPLR